MIEENEPDIFFKELKKIKYWFSKQPDEKVKKSQILEPYKNYFVKTYKMFKKLLKI